jgi:hypothetical protein
MVVVLELDCERHLRQLNILEQHSMALPLIVTAASNDWTEVVEQKWLCSTSRASKQFAKQQQTSCSATFVLVAGVSDGMKGIPRALHDVNSNRPLEN